jgi:hypothetical protein
LKSFEDFTDPLLALEVTSAAALLAKKEEEYKSVVVKTEVKLEEGDATESAMTTPSRNKRKHSSSSSPSHTPKSGHVNIVKREISTSINAILYPTPPETPASSKLTGFFEESPLSGVRQLKRTRSATRALARHV